MKKRSAQFSTAEAAERLGIDRPNLQRLIRQKRIPVPSLQLIGRVKIRLWSQADINAARQALKAERKERAK